MVPVKPRPQPRLLVLGAGTAQLGLLEAARAQDVFVIAVDGEASAPGFRLADRRALIACEDEAAIHRLAEAERIDAVISAGSDLTVGIAARVAHRLGLPHALAPAVAVLATSRLKQRERFVEAGVPHVPWRLATHEHDDVQVPCVVKPSDRGGHGLSVVRDRSELPAAIRAAIDCSRSATALVEELVEGPEVIVHGFTVRGVFHELLTADPGGLGELAAAAVVSLGIEAGPTQTEIRLGPEGPRVAEVVATHDATLWREPGGLDVNLLVLKGALGEPIDVADLVPFGTAHAASPNPVKAAA
jgi:formate-dependent phosphoribosylglycinamide formyltransferase (GAR transformylase)